MWSSVLEFNTFSHFSDPIQLHVADISFPSQPTPLLGISFPEPKNDQYTGWGGPLLKRTFVKADLGQISMVVDIGWL